MLVPMVIFVFTHAMCTLNLTSTMYLKIIKFVFEFSDVSQSIHKDSF